MKSETKNSRMNVEYLFSKVWREKVETADKEQYLLYIISIRGERLFSFSFKNKKYNNNSYLNRVGPIEETYECHQSGTKSANNFLVAIQFWELYREEADMVGRQKHYSSSSRTEIQKRMTKFSMWTRHTLVYKTIKMMFRRLVERIGFKTTQKRVRGEVSKLKISSHIIGCSCVSIFFLP